MGAVLVHEFTTLDGVIDAPTWTFDYPFDPPDVDEIHLFVFPLTLGAGQRLFPEGGPRMNFRTETPRPTTVASCTSRSRRWLRSRRLAGRRRPNHGH
jgi:hypothetical protein